MSTGATQSENADLVAALEHFVVDNDDLLALEERVGRFNIFDALGIVRAEIRHSNYLAWLLDPNESHGQGPLFLKAVLMDLLRQSPPELRPFSPIELDGNELRGVEVRREWKNIDILITCDEPQFVIAIENKIDSGEHSGQLTRYKTTVQESFGVVPRQFVFLTREGDEPTDEEWTVYTYRDIHRTLQRARKANAASIGDDVLTFLDHYLNLIGSRFMDDPKIDELCRTIYKNHRQAIDLIMERCAGSLPGQTAISEWFDHSDEWTIIHQARMHIVFAPSAWVENPEFQRTTANGGKAPWVVFYGAWEKNLFYMAVCVDYAENIELREEIIRFLRLKKSADRWHMKQARSKSFANYMVRVFQTAHVVKWTEGNPPSDEDFVKNVSRRLGQLAEQLEDIPDAVSDVIAKWKARNE